MNTYFCKQCQRDLPYSDFSPSQILKAGSWCKSCSAKRKRDKRNGIVPKRVTDVCLVCGKDISHLRAHARWCSDGCAMKGWRASNPGKHRKHWVKSTYGITPEQFDEMFAAQGFCCAICKTTDPKGTKQAKQWNIDHNHVTGQIRGILCSMCNRGIGQLNDDPALLRVAIEYLESYL